MKSIGIYIHIPFCVSKCVYCDFYSISCGKNGKIKEKRAYTDALIRNIESWCHMADGRKVSTVYIGGGTPTVLETAQLLSIIHALESRFYLASNAEFTVEANPATFDREKLQALRSAGVNRLSIGVQSVIDGELRLLSRIHTAADAEASFDLARNCGFDNLNLDLMYGIPSQTEKSFELTLDKAIALRPEHLSVYGLQIEDGTPLSKNRDRYVFPDEETECHMNDLVCQKLSAAGYERYEISNYSLPGYECRHNLGYWSQGDYLGLGAGAYSHINGKRSYLPKNISLYCGCDDFNSISVTDEILTGVDRDREFIMLSLRLTRGICPDDLNGHALNAEFLLDHAKKFIDGGYMELKNNRIRFTQEGFNISNYILSEMLF